MFEHALMKYTKSWQWHADDMLLYFLVIQLPDVNSYLMQQHGESVMLLDDTKSVRPLDH